MPWSWVHRLVVVSMCLSSSSRYLSLLSLALLLPISTLRAVAGGGGWGCFCVVAVVVAIVVSELKPVNNENKVR